MSGANSAPFRCNSPLTITINDIFILFLHFIHSHQLHIPSRNTCMSKFNVFSLDSEIDSRIEEVKLCSLYLHPQLLSTDNSIVPRNEKERSEWLKIQV